MRALIALLPGLTALSILWVPPALAAPEATLRSPLGPNDSGETKTWCDFAYDALTLTVKDGSSRPATRNFCAAYGKADAKIVTDKAGRHYVFLEYGEGHGTNATTDYLLIYRVNASDLFEVSRTELSWGTAPSQRFTYAYTVGDTPNGGLELTFRGKTEGDDDHPCCIPPEKTRVVRIDASN